MPDPLELQPPATPGGARRIAARKAAPARVTAAAPAPQVVAVGPDVQRVAAAPRTAAEEDAVVRDYLGRVIDLDNTEAATDDELDSAVAGLARVPTTDAAREAFVPARLSDPALRAASVAAAQVVRNAKGTTAPIFYRANGGQSVLKLADQAAASLYWPWLVDGRALFGAGALDEFYLYYSTDHATPHNTSGIYLATGPTPLGPFTARGRVYRDDTGGTQTETPAVFADPTGQVKAIMLYQQEAAPGAVGGQSTLYATSDDGVTWTRGAIAMDIPTWWPSDGHTGYQRPQNMGGELVSYGLAGGWDYPTFGRFRSFDGRNWTIEAAPLAYEVDMLGDGRRMEWNTVDVIWRNGQPWGIGVAAVWTSGAAVGDGRLIAVPLSRDLRRVVGKPTLLLYPTAGTETTNYKGNFTFQGRDGEFYLYYITAGAVFVASTKEP